MPIYESREVRIQRVANDPSMVGYFASVMIWGDHSYTDSEPFLTVYLANKYGIDYEGVSLAADIVRARIDEALFDDRANIL